LIGIEAMFRGRFSRVFEFEAEEESASNPREPLSELRMPALDERARLYLRAVHGRRNFTNEEYSEARNLILDAMVIEFVGKSEPLSIPPERRVRAGTPERFPLRQAAQSQHAAMACVLDNHLAFSVAMRGTLQRADNRRPSIYSLVFPSALLWQQLPLWLLPCS
jgi:hypothetical protein